MFSQPQIQMMSFMNFIPNGTFSIHKQWFPVIKKQTIWQEMDYFLKLWGMWSTRTYICIDVYLRLSWWWNIFETSLVDISRSVSGGRK